MPPAARSTVESLTPEGELLVFVPLHNKTILLDPFTAKVYHYLFAKQPIPAEFTNDKEALDLAVEALKREGLIN